MVEKSKFGRLLVALVLSAAMLGGGFIVFDNLGQSLFGEPAEQKQSHYCVERAIYLQDYLNNTVSQETQSSGVFANPTTFSTSPSLDTFKTELSDARERCVGEEPDVNNPTHRLYLSLQEQAGAYNSWAATIRPLRLTFARDSQRVLSTFSVQ